jgi:A/G-specific adenine glycosylase
VSAFARKLVQWQRRAGRHGLPWQGTRDPYRVWLSEIMLQQTQVAAVVPYYERFLARFPDVEALARAPEDAVLRLWSGLGYYARARNLHKAARTVATMGRFPDTVEGLEALPGVGRSTAGAVAAFAFGRRAAILDGNVKRVLARRFGGPDNLWALAESLLPTTDIETYTQALMDLGATVCTRARPDCAGCPVAADCIARREGRIAELPAPRPRRAIPLRRATWLVLVHGGKVLLAQRPSTGLWGGLWTFPERERGALAAQVLERFGCEVAATRRLAPLEHGFTHFRLAIQPVWIEVRSRGGNRKSQRWLAPAAACRAAIPVPVRAILERLASA